MSVVRPATINDIPLLVQMAGRFHKAVLADKGLGYNPSDFVRHCVSMMELPMTVVLVADTETAKVVGCIAGIISPWFMYPSQVVLLEQWWWVDPEHRGGRIALDLEEEFIKWGKDNGANRIIMISIGSEKEETVKRYYRRKGYKYLEMHFIKEI